MKIDRILESACRKKHIYGATFAFQNEDKSVGQHYSQGDFTDNRRYYIASINKLFISSLILRLFHKGQLKPDDYLCSYLEPEFRSELHFYRGKDYTGLITIRHLLSHTSGLPCYLVDKGPEGSTWMTDLEQGFDHPASPADSLLRASEIEAKFAPGSGKAYYSDTNFQALCIVLESVVGKPVSVLLNDLFRELGMNETAVIDETNISAFTPPRFRDKQLILKQYFTTTGNEIFSTATDQIIFLKAFFNGKLFPKDMIGGLTDWKPVFFPFRYGTGIQEFYAPGIMGLMVPVRNLWGHIGSSGCVAFYSPERGIYVAGTVNQVTQPALSLRLTLKIISKL
jgi:D-alanyl-D-alanine carboxypeptidase